MKKSLAVASVGSMLLARENEHTPTDADWNAFLDLLILNRPHFPQLKILVATDGGGPSAGQIKRLGKALGGGNVRVAVVTDKIRVRFIVSAIALLNSKIKSFARAELHNAYEHLGLTAAEVRLSQQTLLELEALIDPELRWSGPMQRDPPSPKPPRPAA
jgi:hypothetical protein